MEQLEKAARQYHEAHRATAKAQAAQDAAYKAQATAPGHITTLAWVQAVKVQRMAQLVEGAALGALAVAALQVPEVM
ncbi:hypothetical protein [Arthrobacter sp. HY1533]|uniref:hypothetical protein n=1 Tax=Arthrobacter sp. HY1533 TaxID=2970919 RepID=UPI0022B9FF62|nr:hypothetical protein [Arthrobacter sp. HY1533]